MNASPACIAMSPNAPIAANFDNLSHSVFLRISISKGTKSWRYCMIFSPNAPAKSETIPQANLVHSSSFPYKANTM